MPREKELPHRTELERSLSKWLLFEYEFRDSVNLARETEFPEQALDVAFHEGSDEMKKAILVAVSEQAAIPPNILELGALMLEHKDSDIRCLVVACLDSESALPDKVLKAVAA